MRCDVMREVAAPCAAWLSRTILVMDYGLDEVEWHTLSLSSGTGIGISDGVGVRSRTI